MTYDLGQFTSSECRCEHIGTKIKRKLLLATVENRYKKEILEKHLTNMESNVELFENLLCSCRFHLQAVTNANGRHTDYSF